MKLAAEIALAIVLGLVIVVVIVVACLARAIFGGSDNDSGAGWYEP